MIDLLHGKLHDRAEAAERSAWLAWRFAWVGWGVAAVLASAGAAMVGGVW